MTTLFIILQTLSFILALWQNHLLAHKKRHAWGVYVLFSVISVTLFGLKGSYITVVNQGYLGLTAIYPWINWQHKDHAVQKYLNLLGWGVLTGSLVFFRFHDVGDWFEMATWIFIYMKNNLTRSASSRGWIYMMFQTFLAVIFNIIRINYILALRNAVQFGQAIYGYKKWKPPLADKI